MNPLQTVKERLSCRKRSNVTSKFCFVFSLRQGTIFVSLLELTVCGFLLLLLVCGAERSEAIIYEATWDMGKVGWTGDEELLPTAPNYTVYGLWLHRGKQLASVICFMMYVGVVLTVTHMLSLLLLLYGAVKGNPTCLLPWLGSVFIALVIGFMGGILILVLPGMMCRTQLVFMLVLWLIMELNLWTIVLSYYFELVHQAVALLKQNILADCEKGFKGKENTSLVAI